MSDPLTTAEHEYVGRRLLLRQGQDHHFVQFYDDDGVLADKAADFLATGLVAGESLIVIAAVDRVQGIVADLEEKGFDTPRLRENGRLRLLDARELLARIMVDGSPDWDRLHAAISPLLEPSRTHAAPRVRAYGEMVDLLISDGDVDAAIELEAFWNDLRRQYPLTLLCAYRIAHVGHGERRQPFRRVCGYHSHVLPTESYAEIQDAGIRPREISLLQQRIRVLENEIEEHERREAGLRDSIRIRNEFLSIASHELRTPLTALQLYVSTIDRLLQSDVNNPRVREGLGKANRQIARLRSLVEQLLDIPRLDNQTLHLEKTTVDLSALVRDAVASLAGAAEDEGCELRVLADEPVQGEWDAKRIEQVVGILLSNAIKYGRGAPIDIAVGDCGSGARVAVRDRGVGAESAHHVRVFEKLERGELPSFSGFGLGLWIAKQIVDAHHGRMRLSSAPGNGAEFAIELPA